MSDKSFDTANKSFRSNDFILLFIVKLNIKKLKLLSLSDLLILNTVFALRDVIRDFSIITYLIYSSILGIMKVSLLLSYN